MKILSLGAGVQSTAVLLMSCVGDLERIDRAVFADTGWEPKVVYSHLEWLVKFSSSHGIEVDIVSCGRNIKKDEESATMRGIKGDGQRFVSMPYYTVNTSGKGMVRRQCTREYKIDPIRKHIRSIVKPPRRKPNPPLPMVELWYGISMDEAQRMRLARDWWMTNYYPLVDAGMTRSDCLHWISTKGFPTPPRSACVACPFKHDSEWRQLKNESPEEFEDACTFDEKIRGNGGPGGELFVHRSATPLRSVDFSNEEDHGQLNMWREECAGVCGV